MANLGNTTYYAQKTLEDQILLNVISYLQYGLLEIGAYYNIRKGQNDYLGNNASQLKMISGYGVPNNRYYQTLKNQIIWESGINYTFSPTAAQSIIPISGIYYQNTFYPNGSGVLGTGFIVDYNRGLVVFDHPMGTGKVEMEHSLRVANLYNTDDNQYRRLINYYMNRDQWSTAGSGLDNDNVNLRNYLPCIAIHINGFSSKPMGIGSRNKYATANLDFEVLAMTAADRKRLSDLLYLLEEKSFPTFNINEVQPIFNQSGSIYSGTKTWNDLVHSNYMGNGRFSDNANITIPNNTQLPISYSRVRMSVEFPVYFLN